MLVRLSHNKNLFKTNRIKGYMKKSVRLFITGTVQEMFFNPFVKENADKLDVRGFIRKCDDGKIEIFLEGNLKEVNQMIEICKQGQKYSQIRNVEIRDERFQDFKNFKIMYI